MSIQPRALAKGRHLAGNMLCIVEAQEREMERTE